MGKFIFLYKGPATPMDQFTEEQSSAQMAAWGAWMEKVGPAWWTPARPSPLPVRPSRTTERQRRPPT